MSSSVIPISMKKCLQQFQIDATKNAEVQMANRIFRHFVGGTHPNQYIPFPEDGLDGAKKRKKREELNDEVNANNINLSASTRIETISYQWENYGRSPYVHILARPKTKNKTLNSIIML